MAEVKNVIVSFQFDPETSAVTNVLCTVDGVEKKKRVTRKKSDVEEEMAKEPLLTREETKLVFNNKMVADMELEPGERVIIKWDQVNAAGKPDKAGKKLIPIIGKDIAFDEEGNGNKVTKTYTMGYKGKQNDVLAELGEVFTIEPYVTKAYPEGIWKLISTTNPTTAKTLENTIKSVEKVSVDLITETDENMEIDEVHFKL